MAEGDEISEEMREYRTQPRYHGWFQRWLEQKLDVAVYMLGKDPAPSSFQKDDNEESPEEEMRQLERERGQSPRKAFDDVDVYDTPERLRPEHEKRTHHWSDEEYDARRKSLDAERRASDGHSDDIAMGRQ